ncbi:MBL fold metallo-hydrolase [Streptomyces sp. NBRC 109706]|uniref:MBL fold metallo-hydrolase n=1 Tax=Streptomyces sp. NBRC 109706 TaxID=1550035 RepID=UPI0007856361
MINPLTAGLNLRERQLATLRSYLADPDLHTRAVADPGNYGRPFLNPSGAGFERLKTFHEEVTVDAAPLIDLADDFTAARVLVEEHADGGALAPLYGQLPASLRGIVELVYDDVNRASIRILEPVLYRSFRDTMARAQRISLLPRPDRAQPYIFNSPILPDASRFDLAVPFDAPALDALFAARWSSVDVPELGERLGLAPERLARFAEFFTETEPATPPPVPDGTVRVRFFGHASVLLESAHAAVLLDPLLGYTDDGIDHFTVSDLPRRLDAIVLSHAHCDHVSVETLLQLRRVVDTVVVPGSASGSVLDPSLGQLLTALGFRAVTRLEELESATVGHRLTVTSLPFLGEHADLDIRAKMVPLVEIEGRRFVFATDTTPIEPELYRRLGDLLTGVDALFIGLECVGAPLSWLYGPLMGRMPDRRHNRGRRLNGADAAMAEQLARAIGVRRIFTYAMGFDPWLKHLTGSDYDPASPQKRECDRLEASCARWGARAELLHLRAEHTF